jgi:hypothetical protein
MLYKLAFGYCKVHLPLDSTLNEERIQKKKEGGPACIIRLFCCVDYRVQELIYKP